MLNFSSCIRSNNSRLVRYFKDLDFWSCRPLKIGLGEMLVLGFVLDQIGLD